MQRLWRDQRGIGGLEIILIMLVLVGVGAFIVYRLNQAKPAPANTATQSQAVPTKPDDPTTGWKKYTSKIGK